MFSLKTKFAAFGAGIALLLMLAGGIAAFALLRNESLGQEASVVAWLALGMAGVAIIGTAWFTFLHGQRIARALQQLNDSTTRMSVGDFTQPVRTLRRDELGDLQRTIDQMRQNLADTTITKNYLDNVLNSMSDAVFVARPDGTIKFTNSAAQRLTGLTADTLNERTVGALLQGNDSAEADRLRRACEAGEAVLRTESGQTIPVSFSGSVIETADPQFAGLIYVARDITDRKRAERRIRYLARYDALTKIPNRMQFQHLLQQSIARSRRAGLGLALLYIDMDKFKEVNDTFGHASGDRVLEVLTERLTRVLPPEAVLGRLAGDEFALFIDGFPAEGEEGREQVLQLARTVLDAACAAFHINQQEVFLSVSIGISFCPRDGDNVIDIIRNADAAMYHAKQNGGNSLAVYSNEMNAAAVERLMLKSKLRRAVERNEFVVHYQPKVDLIDGRIVGAEALLRWRLPGHGDIPPSQFIPMAEENNLIDAIGEWVLERVCTDVSVLQRSVGNPGRIALNLSLKQLRQATFILKCRDVFTRHHVPPESIELEITESTLMADTARAVQLLNQLAAMGLHLSIDDFGTGYSSLSALQQFPISTLKIDQSFVRDVSDDPGDATLVRTIIDMGHGLGMEVVAEGVETLAQLHFVRDNYCNQAQGKLFGESMPLAGFAELLQAQNAGPPAFAHLIVPEMAQDERA